MTNPPLAYDVVIVGGGITGLAAAWSLQQLEPAPRYSVLEAGPRWGGKILTETVSGPDESPFIVEGGPDSFITQKPWALQLARTLGMEDQLLPTNEAQRRVYVLHRGRPVPLPEGVMLIVPTAFMPFIRSRLLTLPGKLRMGLDWFIPAKTDGEDETLADFINRRLGSEALDKIAEPLLAGIYNAEADRQSLLATFPRFRALEERHGSLIRGMLAGRRARASAPPPAGNGQRPPSAFISFRGGMGELVEALTARLSGDMHLNTSVAALSRSETGYRLQLEDGRSVTASAIVLAVPAYVAGQLLGSIAPRAVARLRSIRYVSTGTVSLAFPRRTLRRPLDGFGVVIPRSERRQINAITCTSTKFDHRAPDSHVLLRVFFGGSRTPETMGLSDRELLAVVRRELESIVGIRDEPTLQRIYRWAEANPQYDVGHLGLVSDIETALPDGVFVAGSPYRGIGIPDCVHQAEQAVERVSRYLVTRPEAVVPSGRSADLTAASARAR